MCWHVCRCTLKHRQNCWWFWKNERMFLLKDQRASGIWQVAFAKSAASQALSPQVKASQINLSFLEWHTWRHSSPCPWIQALNYVYEIRFISGNPYHNFCLLSSRSINQCPMGAILLLLSIWSVLKCFVPKRLDSPVCVVLNVPLGVNKAPLSVLFSVTREKALSKVLP